VTIDLFRPVKYQRMINKRQTGKGWRVMFMCTSSSAVHVEFASSYSTTIQTFYSILNISYSITVFDLEERLHYIGTYRVTETSNFPYARGRLDLSQSG
jgi:hypothetical protein